MQIFKINLLAFVYYEMRRPYKFQCNNENK